MKVCLRLLTLLLVIISYMLPVHSQTYTFRGISGTEGLTDLMVSALYKDTFGYVWIGTATSVERFDGSRLKYYPIVDKTTEIKWVNVITETIEHKILVGSDNGLWQINDDGGLEPIIPETIKGGAVRALVVDSVGTLYIGSTKGLIIYKDEVAEVVLMDKNHFSDANDITGLSLDENGFIWLTTKKGLYSVRMEDKQITYYSNNLLKKAENVVFRTMTRIGTTLYLGTMTEGILSFNISTKQFSRYIDVGCKVIMSLSTDGEDLLYVGTDGNGAHFISTQQKKIVRHIGSGTESKSGLRSNSIYSLLVDRDGLVWVGLYQFGVDYTVFQNDLFSTYRNSFFSSEDIPVRAIYIDKKRKYIGSRNGLFYVDEAKKRVEHLKFPVLRSNIVTCIYAFQEEIYIGTYEGGMYIFNPETLELRDFDTTRERPFLKGSVFCIKEDSSGCLWIGTSDGVFRYKDGKLLTHFTQENSSLPGRNIYAIFFDSTHKGWIATDKGLCLWESSSERLRTDLFPKGYFQKEKISTIYEDSEHNLYFLPHKGKVWRSDLSMDNFHTLPSEDYLERKNVVFIIEDKEKWLWIGTNNGLYHYDKKKSFVGYGVADGIPGSIFINCIPQYDEEGTLWLGNTKGLISLKEDWQQRGGKSKYPIKITEVRINGNELVEPILRNPETSYEMDLQVSQNNITICFSDFAYIDPLYAAYEYKMEGKDDKWQTLSGKSEVTYYNLPKGTHRFKVRHVNDVNSEAELCIRISSTGRLRSAVFSSILIVLVGLLLFVLANKRKKRPMDNPALEIPVCNEPCEQTENNSTIKEKYKSYSLSDEECRQLADNLDRLMLERKPHINPDLKIADLAAAAGISSYTLSYLFNQYLKRGYYDYINDYRIAEFKDRIQKGEHIQYTVDTLIGLCGFSSRSTFFRHFKKMTGTTPNEYIKTIKIQ